MNSESMWLISVEDHEPSKPIFDLINQQANYLSTETGGKVKGVLARATSSWHQIAQAISSTAAFLTDAYSSTHNHNANDASDLYNKKTYEFYIINEEHNYELSLFQITCNDTLPATMVIEPTIASEEGLKETIEIDSINEFTDIFRSIIRSNKVTYIIDRLLKLPSNQQSDNEKE